MMSSDIHQNFLQEEDWLWSAIYQEALTVAQQEPLLASFLYMTVLCHSSLEDVAAYHLSSKLACKTMDARALMELFREAFGEDPQIGLALREDILAYYERDPACDAYSMPLLYYKGFHVILAQRIMHWLWRNDRKAIAYFLQNHVSEALSVDIHPAAHIGKGVMLDHGSGVVIGETAVVGHNVSMLHNVTLGGSGKETGDRHPKVGNGVMIGAGASILGNICIGDGAKVGAGSVVLENVPPYATVVGVPAKVVGSTRGTSPALEMDQRVGPCSDDL